MRYELAAERQDRSKDVATSIVLVHFCCALFVKFTDLIYYYDESIKIEEFDSAGCCTYISSSDRPKVRRSPILVFLKDHFWTRSFA